jgi:hypothetical protein
MTSFTHFTAWLLAMTAVIGQLPNLITPIAVLDSSVPKHPSAKITREVSSGISLSVDSVFTAPPHLVLVTLLSDHQDDLLMHMSSLRHRLPFLFKDFLALPRSPHMILPPWLDAVPSTMKAIGCGLLFHRDRRHRYGVRRRISVCFGALRNRLRFQVDPPARDILLRHCISFWVGFSRTRLSLIRPDYYVVGSIVGRIANEELDYAYTSGLPILNFPQVISQLSDKVSFRSS